MANRDRPTASHKSSSRRTPSGEESLLRASLGRLERFIDLLTFRAEQARGRATDATEGSKAKARALLRAEEAWADLQAGRRLQDAVRAAESIAVVQTALVEAEAAEAIQSAFRQFATARAWRRGARRAAEPDRAQAAASLRSMDELGQIAADATHAVGQVITDRDRLARGIAEAGLNAAEFRQAAGQAAASGSERRSFLERAAMCEAHAAYLRTQLLAQARAAEALSASLKKLLEKLPEEAATLAAARVADRPSHDLN